MKSNIKIVITAVIAIAIGLGAGYLIFGNQLQIVKRKWNIQYL